MTARNHWLAVAGIALATIVTFHSVLLPPRPVVANDSPTANVMVGRQWWESGRSVLWLTDGYLGRNGGVMTYGLTTPFQRWLPPEYFNTALFALFTFVAGVGCYLFLVSLGLSPLAGFTGACALMLSGDFITCVFSGHLGKFTMWAFLMLSLWLLTLGITRRSIVAMLWCGICTGIGVSGQLDVGFIVCLFYAAWAALLLWQTRESKKWPRMAAGFAVAAVAAFLYSSMTVVSLLGLANQGASNASEEERSPQEKWNWATQWSLPKQETLTFIAPGFYGFGHSGDSPYWGRIGQDANWPAQHQGFPRFSINTQG
ncbi:hypothetical protein GX586_09195, partial [bacterium]|nr:hypothetical protein [bacterium]